MKEKKYFMTMYLFKNGLKDFRDHYIKLKNKSAPIWVSICQKKRIENTKPLVQVRAQSDNFYRIFS